MMLINLCFHGIGTCRVEREPGEAGYWMKEDVFLGVLDLVRDRPNVRLSFDDGNKSDVALALPALAERGLKADFFALAGRLSDPMSVSGEDLRALRAAGMGIGSHGWSHIPWRRLMSSDFARELDGARVALGEASGTSIDSAAFPLGRYDRRVLAELKRRGYRRVFTSDRFPARPDSWLQARYSVTSADTVETVRAVLDHRPGVRDARNLLVSMGKRLR